MIQHCVRVFGVTVLSFLVLSCVALDRVYAFETKARQAIVFDYTSGTVLYAKNADEQMVPSSMSKLMTTYVLFDQLKSGALSLDDTFHVSENAWKKGGSKMFLELGSQVKLEDLLRGIIIQSGNDACIAAAEGVYGDEATFAEAMTKQARRLGLNNSYFSNATGWPDPEHLMSARDLATLAGRLLEDFPEFYHYFSESIFTYNNIKQHNRNTLLSVGLGVDGLKTGHTDAGGHGIVISAIKNNRRLIVVVNGLATEKERAEEAKRLLLYGLYNFENITLFEKGQEVTQAQLYNGRSLTVPLIASDDIILSVPRHQEEIQTNFALVYDPINAPVKQGQGVAKLQVTFSDGSSKDFLLESGADIQKRKFYERIWYNARTMMGSSS